LIKKCPKVLDTNAGLEIILKCPKGYKHLNGRISYVGEHFTIKGANNT
jgi:hypothetical protein